LENIGVPVGNKLDRYRSAKKIADHYCAFVEAGPLGRAAAKQKAPAGNRKVVSLASARTKKLTKQMRPCIRYSYRRKCSATTLAAAAYYADENVLIFNMEVGAALRLLAGHGMIVN
jgi:hypothetical protein